VVVAVIPVGMMQVPADQVIDMLAMRHRLMAAVRPVATIVLVALMALGAVGGVGARDRDRVALDATLGVVVQLAVVEVIDVIAMTDRRVAAARTVLVLVCVTAHQ
jgi:hypothetical protein